MTHLNPIPIAPQKSSMCQPEGSASRLRISSFLPSGVSVSTFVVIAFRRSVNGTELISKKKHNKNQRSSLILFSSAFNDLEEHIKINSMYAHRRIYNTFFLQHIIKA